MKVIKTQLANGKFKYTAQHNGVDIVLVKASTKEFVEISIKEWGAPFEGRVTKFQASTKEVNNLRNFVAECQPLSQHKDHAFHICKVETIEEVKEEVKEEAIIINTNKNKLAKKTTPNKNTHSEYLAMLSEREQRKNKSTEVLIDGSSYDLMRDIENMTGVKF